MLQLKLITDYNCQAVKQGICNCNINQYPIPSAQDQTILEICYGENAMYLIYFLMWFIYSNDNFTHINDITATFKNNNEYLDTVTELLKNKALFIKYGSYYSINNLENIND